MVRVTITNLDGTQVGPLVAQNVSFLNGQSYGKLFDAEVDATVLYVWPSNCLSIFVEEEPLSH